MADILTPAEPPVQPPRRNMRDRWEQEVWTTTDITDGCRVLLLALAKNMDAKGYVSVPRTELARQIGRNERRVGERLEQAVESHYLTRVRRGQKGVTSVYRAMLPAAQQAANPPAEITAAVQPADGVFSRPPGGPASSKRSTPGSVRTASTSSFEEEVGSTGDHDETAAINAALIRACHQWNMPVPDELRDTA